MNSNGAITVSNLKVLLEADKVSHFELLRRERGYEVAVWIWRRAKEAPERTLLLTTRNWPRKWVSVDGFIRHLEGQTALPLKVIVQLDKGGETERNTAI